MAPIGCEDVVVRPQRGGHASGDRLLASGQVAGALDKVLEEEVVRSLLEVTNTDLRSVHPDPGFRAR